MKNPTTRRKSQKTVSAPARSISDVADEREELEKRGRGRPTLYREEYARIARMLCSRAAATDEELAEAFGVTVSTINLWKMVYPDFSESIKKGKVEPDDLVERSLFERATGYSHPDTHFSAFEGIVTATPTVKYYPPETTAAIFWLKNRRKDKWRDKTEVDVKNLTWEQMVAEARKPAASTDKESEE